jgi:hypothetical protein
MAAAVALALGLSACGGDDEPATKHLTLPKAGQCIAKEVTDGTDVAPDTESVVPCTQKHSYEIVATFPIPLELLAGKTKKAKLARRTELADVDSKSTLRQKLTTTVFRKCAQPFREASGLDRVSVLGKSAADVGLRVSANVSQWTTVSSPDLWLQGKAMAVCSYRFGVESESEGIPKLLSVRSTSTKPVMASYLTNDFPISARGCAGSSTEDWISCTQPHSQERLWALDMKAVYGKKFLSSADLPRVSPDEGAKLRAACNDSYKQAGGTISDDRTMGVRFYSKYPATGSVLPMVCTLSAKGAAGAPLDRTFSAF